MSVLFEVHQYAVILNGKKEVLWINSTGGKKKLMFPGGTLEEKEDLIESLIREILEETGLNVFVEKLFHSDVIYSKDPPHLGLIYLCHSDNEDVSLSDEHDEYIWKSPDEIDENLVAHPTLIKIAKLAISEDGK